MWKKGSKRYVVIWEAERKYIDSKYLFVAKLIWCYTSADHILDTKKETAIYSKTYKLIV